MSPVVPSPFELERVSMKHAFKWFGAALAPAAASPLQAFGGDSAAAPSPSIGTARRGYRPGRRRRPRSHRNGTRRLRHLAMAMAGQAQSRLRRRDLRHRPVRQQRADDRLSARSGPEGGLLFLGRQLARPATRLRPVRARRQGQGGQALARR
ncbi:Exonuclease SbcC [Burkholderia gladioli]|nr:Exonuclease SbcC [Burkholderia gladioli]